MKFVVVSDYSQTVLRKVEDSFTLTMSDTCADNRIKVGSFAGYTNNAGDADLSTPANVDDFTYIIGAASEFRIPLISTLSATCATYSELFVFDPSANEWIDQTTPSAPYSDWIAAFDTTKGKLEVN
jgi:sugar phosphate isomerase/epimerase